MKSREEVKASLKNWMISTVRATQRRYVLTGKAYHPSDIVFLFREKGIKMNEAFVKKCLEPKK